MIDTLDNGNVSTFTLAARRGERAHCNCIKGLNIQFMKGARLSLNNITAKTMSQSHDRGNICMYVQNVSVCN